MKVSQNSILRGQGAVYMRCLEWVLCFPTFCTRARERSRRQKSAFHKQRQERWSRGVVAVFMFDRFSGALGPRRLTNMSNANGGNSAREIIYLANNGKDDNGDDSVG